MNAHVHRSAWREPMVWMLVGLPLAAVVIGFGLLYAAVRPGSQDLESPDQVKHWAGMPIAPQQLTPKGPLAQELIVRNKPGMIEVVPTDPRFPRGGKLTLTLTADAGPSRVYHLTPSELGWHGPGEVTENQPWHLQLSSDSATWHLHGQWLPQARFARLTP
ncbi:hypothetical protein [Aerosticca soli]|jgi:hypothetical protein|uniref:Nitrogen fixation protein FixH n=1 Tax=Aerosticca soli TaxID=2010829 RepID=A0A2Z6E3J1_9GAMM|nr:hypothetical protein [Aerosticca soli]MDI3262720.1 hypothetical protein [Fulvimonas sp.]BBD79344.1 hypothetical protein ALSL_0678 [Aerosticca soli]